MLKQPHVLQKKQRPAGVLGQLHIRHSTRDKRDRTNFLANHKSPDKSIYTTKIHIHFPRTVRRSTTNDMCWQRIRWYGKISVRKLKIPRFYNHECAVSRCNKIEQQTDTNVTRNNVYQQ